MHPSVVAVSRSAGYTFSKPNQASIRLLAGLGVEDDAHLGTTVRHRFDMRRDPTKPNLRQVHLIHAELFDTLQSAGFVLAPGDIGENVLTRGVHLLGLPVGTRLRLGSSAVVEVTGLRNPCRQLDNFAPGLTATMIDRDAEGNLIRKAGIMGIVLTDGEVRAGDPIEVEMPSPPHRPLGVV
jgi:MOSC domain-containing protein YiiM